MWTCIISKMLFPISFSKLQVSPQLLYDRQRHVYIIIIVHTHLSTSRQIQTIKYDMRVPIDVMSTSCSRLNMDDNMPGTKNKQK